MGKEVGKTEIRTCAVVWSSDTDNGLELCSGECGKMTDGRWEVPASGGSTVTEPICLQCAIAKSTTVTSEVLA